MARLLDQIEGLRRVIEDRGTALDAMRSFLSQLEHMAADLSPKALDILEKTFAEVGIIERSDELQEPAKPQRRRNVLPPREVANAIRNVLLECGRPMKRGEIVSELEKRGIPLPGKDTKKNVGTIIWRYRNEFIRVDEYGYWLKDVPIPQVFPWQSAGSDKR